MNYLLFILGQLLLIILVGIVLWAISRGMQLGYYRLRVSTNDRKRLLNYNIAFLIFWLAILAHLAWLGFFTDKGTMAFRILGSTLVLVLGGLMLLSQKGFRLFIKMIPLRWLILIQTFRIPLEIIQWIGYEGGYVPVQMTFAGLNYDIMVGLSALVAASTFFRRNQVKRLEAIIWNLFGLGLLLNMQVVLFFSVPSDFQVWQSAIDYWAIGTAPFIWIPGFLTPIAILAHIYALKLLWSTQKPARTFRLRKKTKPTN